MDPTSDLYMVVMRKTPAPVGNRTPTIQPQSKTTL